MKKILILKDFTRLHQNAIVYEDGRVCDIIYENEKIMIMDYDGHSVKLYKTKSLSKIILNIEEEIE